MIKKAQRQALAHFACILMLCSCCSKNIDTHVPAPASLLPSPPPEWRQIERKTYSGLTLSDYINGGAEAYYAYGFREVAVADFQSSTGSKLTIEIYQTDRSENAYGIFSTDSRGEDWSIGADSSYESGLLRFWKGPYFIRILSFPAPHSVEDDIRRLGNRIAAAITLESRRPDLLKVVPAHASPGTVCYFHRQTSLNNIYFLSDENLLKLGDDVEAVTWRQAMADEDSQQVRLMVIRYASEPAAAQAMKGFARQFLQKEIPPAELLNRIHVSRKKESFSGGYAQADHLILVFDAAGRDSAAGVLKETGARVFEQSAKRGGAENDK